MKWLTTIPPSKNAFSYKELGRLQWMEIMQKDVKCIFGIMKSRWRILKSPIQLKGMAGANKVRWTCCAFLHSWLLEVDAIDIRYKGISQSFNPRFSKSTMKDIPFVLRPLEYVTTKGKNWLGFRQWCIQE